MREVILEPVTRDQRSVGHVELRRCCAHSALLFCAAAALRRRCLGFFGHRGEILSGDLAYRPPAGAETALSALLSRLRSVLGGDILFGRGEIHLRLPADAWIDLEAAEEAIHRAEAAVAQQDWARGWGPSLIAIFTARRGFLPNEDLPWADEYRQRLEEVHIAALECYAAVALGVGGSELAP